MASLQAVLRILCGSLPEPMATQLEQTALEKDVERDRIPTPPIWGRLEVDRAVKVRAL